MPDLTITLGGIAFQDFEVPERISGLGGEQMLAVHKLVGGDRVVDAMGRDDANLSWSGRFRGVDAVTRAGALDGMRGIGAQQKLTFGDFSYTVVVQRFAYEIEKFYEVPYSIELVVLQDNSISEVDVTPQLDEMLDSDSEWAQSLGTSIGNITLTGLLGSVASTIGAVRNFIRQPLAVLNGILSPIFAARDFVDSLIVSAEGTILYGSTFGTSNPVLLTEPAGVVPLVGPDVNATSLTIQVAATAQVANLYDLHNVLSRMATNIAAIGQSGAWVTQAGGDLYSLALTAYGDATEWATIARANGLTDPVLEGLTTVLVPPVSGDTQGVLTDVRPAPAAAGAVSPFLAPADLSGGMLDGGDPDDTIFITVV